MLPPPLFFNINFFSYYNINNILQLSIHAGFLTCQKPTMDRNYCLIVFIVCQTVIHRKLQNEYEKKIDVQKKKGGEAT